MSILNHMFSWPTLWVWIEMIWITSFAWLGYKLHLKNGWFKEPITARVMFWEFCLGVVLTGFLDTEFQLEGFLLVLKYHYLKEWWKQDRNGRITLILMVSIVALFLLLVL